FRLVAAVIPVLAAACGARSAPGPLAPLPAPAPATGPLAIRLAYPLEITHALHGDTSYIGVGSETLPATDSTFIYGSVGRGNTTLTVNGATVPVYPTGGWIAWLPVPRDTIARFVIVATAGSDTARAVLQLPVIRRFTPPPRAAWIDSTSLVPRGTR